MKHGSVKTTVTGVLTILTAVVSAALHYTQTGTLPDLGVLISAITAGLGLIAARDNNVSSEEAGIKK